MKIFQPLDRVKYVPTGKIYVVRMQFIDGDVSLQSLHRDGFAQFSADSLELVTPAPDMTVANSFIAQAEMMVARIRQSKKLDWWQKDWLKRELEKILKKIDE